MNIFLYSTLAILLAFILDFIFADPYNFPHIVRYMGNFISYLEKKIEKAMFNNDTSDKRKRAGGTLLVVLVMIFFFFLPFSLLFLSYKLFIPLGFLLETFFCYQFLAAKSLKKESMKVFKSLQEKDLRGARYNLSMIVGRDTMDLDEKEVTKACVETVAENTADGVVAPLIYLFLGGASLGSLYKSVNTMDSMLGYKNERYINFGRTAALVDDVFNYIPARISGLLMIVAAFLLGFNGKNAYRIWKRDRRNHASPNSAQTESVCAGALEIRLAGPAFYGGKLQDKPFIGDDIRPIEKEDIVKANKLMYVSGIIALVVGLLIRVILGVMLNGAI